MILQELEFEKFQDTIRNLFEQKTIQDSVKYFLSFQKKPYLYLKWLPHLYAFKVIKTKPFVEKEIIRLYESDPHFNLNQLKDPLKVESLKQIVKKVAGDKEMFPYITFHKEQPTSLFFLNEQNPYLKLFISCLDKHCESLSLEEKISAPASRQHFLKILFNEVSRSRHLGQPVSLLLVRLLTKVEEKEQIDIFFKSLRRHLSKNYMLYDVIFQINSQDLGIILPHTSIQEAIKKAQKLSWMLDSIKYRDMFNLKRSLKFQVAVAEYPTISRDAMDLLKKAELSAGYVEEGTLGGVCVSTTIKGFRPDFNIKDSDVSFEINK